MHTVELLEEAQRVAGELGYVVRIEPLDGRAGSCVVGGRKLIFVDLAGGPADRLDTLVEVLCGDPGLANMGLSPTLARMLGRRCAA